MVGAYILINCETGKTGTAAKKIRSLRGVKNVGIVTGLHDIIAFVESKDLTKLATTVVNRIQKVGGVSRTVTMVAVDL
jgi:DNA-binding Lrp family transcriptional regulator